MTCKEKLIAEHPEWTKADISYFIHNKGCPSVCGYLDNPDICSSSYNECERCWDREIPEDKKEKEKMCECSEKRELVTMIKQFQFDNDSLQKTLAEKDRIIESRIEAIDKLRIEVDNLTDRVEDQKETIRKYQKMRRCIEDLGCTVTTDFVVIPPVKHITSAELELMDLKARYEALSSSYNSKKKALDTQNEVINSLHDKVKLRDAEIDKLVKENEKLRKSVDILTDGIDRRENENTGLYNKISELDRTIEEQQEKIKLRTEEIDKLVKENEELRTWDNVQTVINLKKYIAELDDKLRDTEYAKYKLNQRIDGLNEQINAIAEKAVEEKTRYEKTIKNLERDNEELRTQADIRDKVDSELSKAYKTYISLQNNSTIVPIDELPYARYAGHIRLKYLALTDSGFSHDDAMGLIPMWTDC